jgi:hypothetical protein
MKLRVWGAPESCLQVPSKFLIRILAGINPVDGWSSNKACTVSNSSENEKVVVVEISPPTEALYGNGVSSKRERAAFAIEIPNRA